MTMTVTQSVITIAAVVLGTMTTRFLPFLVFPEGREPPAFIRYLGAVLPYAVIGLLLVYCLKDAVFASYHALPELIAIASRTASGVAGIASAAACGSRRSWPAKSSN